MDALHGRWLNGWRKSLTATTQECCEQFWTGPWGNNPQSSSSTATHHPSRKLSGHCWRSRDELISDVLLWTPHNAKVPARTYIQQLCEDTRCSPEDRPEAMNDRGEWRKRVMDIRAGGTRRWWWWCLKSNRIRCDEWDTSDNILTGKPLLSRPPKPLIAIRSSCGFSHLWPGVFHISLKTYKTRHTQPRVWKKRRINNHRLGLAPSARREFVTLWYYLPTPPPGQDMTQGQFLSGV